MNSIKKQISNVLLALLFILASLPAMASGTVCNLPCCKSKIAKPDSAQVKSCCSERDDAVKTSETINPSACHCAFQSNQGTLPAEQKQTPQGSSHDDLTLLSPHEDLLGREPILERTWISFGDPNQSWKAPPLHLNPTRGPPQDSLA